MAPLSSPRDLGLAKIFARVLASSPTLSPPTLVERQDAPAATVTVVVDNDDGGGSGTYLSGGAIAGIVIGSIVGTLLLLWIIKSCMNLGAPPQGENVYDIKVNYRYTNRQNEREPWYHHTEKPRHRHRSRSRRSSVSVPPAVVIRDSTSRSRHRGSSPSYHYTDSDRGRTGRSRYYV
ncbi:hypothetical protein FALBO_2179 [Fusarium albosuccineum]|uniref:Uncharacterized protein n=1 Tax=Fusarium albosuccineum TaxID=1237068 RepID=A0A8H4LN79_9HYPO|nr:hypothetical protein FALBO_2179 [Fusarium albosuccineum]